MHPNVIASCEGFQAVVVGHHGAMDVFASIEIVESPTFVLVQVEVEVVGTLFQTSNASCGEFQAFEIHESVRVSALKHISCPLEIHLGAFDEAGLQSADGAIPPPVGHDADVKTVVGVRQAVILLEDGEVHLLVRAAQGEITGLSRLGLNPTQVLVHHESPNHRWRFWGVRIKNLKEVIAASGPLQVVVGQQQLVVHVVHLRPKTGFFILHRGRVKPSNVFAWMKV